MDHRSKLNIEWNLSELGSEKHFLIEHKKKAIKKINKFTSSKLETIALQKILLQKWKR